MNREQCRGCDFFLGGGGGQKAPEATKFCHYLLQTGQRRQVGENDVCLSRQSGTFKAKNPFYEPLGW